MRPLESPSVFTFYPEHSRGGSFTLRRPRNEMGRGNLTVLIHGAQVEIRFISRCTAYL